MLTTAILLGLTVVALLCLWNSYIISPIREAISRVVVRLGHPLLIYLSDCDYCKGFWMCVIGGIIVANWLVILPAYAIVVIGLSVGGAKDD